MVHKKIVGEMSKVDAPYLKLAFAFNSIERRRAHSVYFERLTPLVSEIIPLSERISPSAILGGVCLTKNQGNPMLVLKLAGGLHQVTENARRIDERMGAVEREFEESVRKVDFQKLERRESWYRVFHKAVVAPMQVAAYSVLAIVTSSLICNPIFGTGRIFEGSGGEKFLLGSLFFSAFALAFSNLMNSRVNPAVRELNESISNLREGISGMKEGVREILQTTSFFRGS